MIIVDYDTDTLMPFGTYNPINENDSDEEKIKKIINNSLTKPIKVKEESNPFIVKNPKHIDDVNSPFNLKMKRRD